MASRISRGRSSRPNGLNASRCLHGCGDDSKMPVPTPLPGPATKAAFFVVFRRESPIDRANEGFDIDVGCCLLPSGVSVIRTRAASCIHLAERSGHDLKLNTPKSFGNCMLIGRSFICMRADLEFFGLDDFLRGRVLSFKMRV